MNYVVFDPLNDLKRPEILSTVCQEVTFPLDRQTQQELIKLEQQFDNEDNPAGLAAPQIGIAKGMVIFEAPDEPALKKWRPDLSDTMDKTIWLNPSYQGIEEAGTSIDYEGCFSVANVTGPVTRFNQIHYQAMDLEGNKITGTAKGFLARVIQHEIDHLDGILFIDKIEDKSKMISIKEYQRRKAQALG